MSLFKDSTVYYFFYLLLIFYCCLSGQFYGVTAGEPESPKVNFGNHKNRTAELFTCRSVLAVTVNCVDVYSEIHLVLDCFVVP